MEKKEQTLFQKTAKTAAQTIAGLALLSQLLRPEEVGAQPIDNKPEIAATNVDPEKNKDTIKYIQGKKENYFGSRLTDSYEGENGTRFVVFQGAAVEESGGERKLAPILNYMHEMGLDDQLADGSLGVKIPKMSSYQPAEASLQDSLEFFKVSSEFQEYLKKVSQELNIGKVTAFPNIVTDAETGAKQEIVRLEGMAFIKHPDGTFERILIGEALKNSQLIPENALLPEPVVDELIIEFVAPVYNPIQSWTGSATYYSHAGCLGCSAGQIMANGQPFREMALTLAFMKTPLNCTVRVTNQANGQSVNALVTDRGGFEPYGILADLSVGTRNAIGGGSRTSVRIDLLHC